MSDLGEVSRRDGGGRGIQANQPHSAGEAWVCFASRRRVVRDPIRVGEGRFAFSA
jgi:hypothetical protein